MNLGYRLSKFLAHTGCLVPLAWLVYAAYNRLLGGDPQEKMLHELGLWTLIYLLLGLSVTPLRQILGLSILIRFRRMLGLYAAFYLTLHITVFFYFYLESDISYLWREILERPYVTVGMLATVLITPLVLTSTWFMQKKLGQNWKTLHKLAYVIPALGVIHFIWQSKSDLNEPMWYFIWLVILLGFRFYKKVSKP